MCPFNGTLSRDYFNRAADNSPTNSVVDCRMAANAHGIDGGGGVKCQFDGNHSRSKAISTSSRVKSVTSAASPATKGLSSGTAWFLEGYSSRDGDELAAWSRRPRSLKSAESPLHSAVMMRANQEPQPPPERSVGAQWTSQQCWMGWEVHPRAVTAMVCPPIDRLDG